MNTTPATPATPASTPFEGGYLRLSDAVARLGGDQTLRGRLQVAYWRGALPGRKLNPAAANSALLVRMEDVLAYLDHHRRRRRQGQRTATAR